MTITPEELAALISLAVWQEGPEQSPRIPDAGAIARGFGIPPATARAALARLQHPGTDSPAEGRLPRSGVTEVMAAAGACQLLQPGTGPAGDGILAQDGEALLAAGRRALRGRQPGEAVMGRARDILRRHGNDPAADMARHPGWAAAVAGSGPVQAPVPGPGFDILSFAAAISPFTPPAAPGSRRAARAAGRDAPAPPAATPMSRNRAPCSRPAASA